MDRKPRPTKKQKGAAELIAQGESVSGAMRMVGYAEATSKNPKNLTESDGFRSLGERIPDDLVLERITDLLNKKETVEMTDPDTGEKTIVRTEEIHVQGVKAGVEASMRVKGIFNPEIIPIPVKGNTYNFFNNVEIKATTNEYEQKLKEVLYKEKKD